jgi:hypothetical protein
MGTMECDSSEPSPVSSKKTEQLSLLGNQPIAFRFSG